MVNCDTMHFTFYGYFCYQLCHQMPYRDQRNWKLKHIAVALNHLALVYSMDTYALNNAIKCLTEIKEIGNESIDVASHHLVLVYSMDTYALNNGIKCLTEIKRDESIVVASNHLALI